MALKDCAILDGIFLNFPYQLKILFDKMRQLFTSHLFSFGKLLRFLNTSLNYTNLSFFLAYLFSLKRLEVKSKFKYAREIINKLKGTRTLGEKD